MFAINKNLAIEKQVEVEKLKSPVFLNDQKLIKITAADYLTNT